MFERLGLARAEAFNDVFKLKQAILDGFGDANAVGAGVMRDYTGLPHVEQAANATAHGYKDQAIERRHSPVVVRDAAQVCAIAVQHKTEISVQQREQYSRDT